MGIAYEYSDWRLFIDSSNKSHKTVLLYNGNIVSSIPVCYSMSMSENYNNMIVLLDSLNYNNHNWMIFGDLKVIYYNIYYNNYNYLKCFIILIYIYICRSSPYFWVFNLGISNTHIFSSNGIVELIENIIQGAYGQNVIIYILVHPI